VDTHVSLHDEAIVAAALAEAIRRESTRQRARNASISCDVRRQWAAVGCSRRLLDPPAAVR
jgi:hypothetical protein